MSRYLSLSTVMSWVPLMENLGVSEVARSSRGFVRAYRDAAGRALYLPDEWRRRREAFIARHMAQVIQNDEPLYDEHGRPTRRHLALVAWAFSPDPTGLRRALDSPRQSSRKTKRGSRV